MKRDERAELTRELYDPDHPNYAELEFEGVRVPGSFSRQPLITDEYSNLRSTFSMSKYDYEDLNLDEDDDFQVVVDDTEVIDYYLAACEVPGPSTVLIILGVRNG